MIDDVQNYCNGTLLAEDRTQTESLAGFPGAVFGMPGFLCSDDNEFIIQKPTESLPNQGVKCEDNTYKTQATKNSGSTPLIFLAFLDNERWEGFTIRSQLHHPHQPSSQVSNPSKPSTDQSPIPQPQHDKSHSITIVFTGNLEQDAHK